MPKFRRAFSPELKLEAVRQVTEGGRSVPEVAREVGVRPEQLRTWKKQALAAGTVSRQLRVESAEEEVRRLQRELDVVRQERDFLKKAMVDSSGQPNTSLIFSSEVWRGEDWSTRVAFGQAVTRVGDAEAWTFDQ